MRGRGKTPFPLIFYGIFRPFISFPALLCLYVGNFDKELVASETE